MSLDKAIASGKEHRKEYTGAKAIDPQCRCGGGCEWCRGNRRYKHIKRMDSLESQLKEYEGEDGEWD